MPNRRKRPCEKLKRCRACSKPGANTERGLCLACQKVADTMFERAVELAIKDGLVEVESDSSGKEYIRLTPLGAKVKRGMGLRK